MVIHNHFQDISLPSQCFLVVVVVVAAVAAAAAVVVVVAVAIAVSGGHKACSSCGRAGGTRTRTEAVALLVAAVAFS